MPTVLLPNRLPLRRPLDQRKRRTVSWRWPGLCALLALIVPGLFPGVASAQPAETATAAMSPEAIDYRSDIAPILQAYCVGCHLDDDRSGGLSMESYASLSEGGDHGPAITAGEPASSRLLQMTSGTLEPKMPPDDMAGPTEEELELITRWIEAGARGPSGEAPLPMLKTPDIEPQVEIDEPVTALACSPRGDILAIGGFAFVELRDVDTDRVRQRIEGLPGKVNDVAFSADGRWLAIASGITGLRGTATIVDLQSGQTRQQIEAHGDAIFAVALSPDGGLLATGSYDAEILLWELPAGKRLQSIAGHNGGVFDLAFAGDGSVLASASADETVKLWQIPGGQRLDTLSQPQGEVWSVAFSPDGRSIVAASADQRIRIWRLVSKTQPAINPLMETRYADEAPLVNVAFTPGGDRLIVGSQMGNLAVFETDNWTKVGELDNAGDAISSLAVLPDAATLRVATLDGRVQSRTIPPLERSGEVNGESLEPVYLVLDPPQTVELSEPVDNSSPQTAVPLPRGARVKGVIQAGPGGRGETDWYRFEAHRGEVWMVEINAARSKSPLDSRVEVRAADGTPLTRVRLQAIRESYFTFRGKNSTQSNDFRLFGWEEMGLNDLLYSSGEVTKLWLYPRGPDSGFNVYPGSGARHTFYDTSPIAHALQEPAYVVRPLAPGEQPVSNGLPVFTIDYVNDDDATRRWGTDSRLRFTAPTDGQFTIAVSDSRGQGGDSYHYELTLRPAAPDFRPSVSPIKQPIPAGSGREFKVSVSREDGYDGPVTFEVLDIPAGLRVTTPIVVEAGQREAYGVVWCDAETPDDQSWPGPRLVAHAQVLGRRVERRAGSLGDLKSAAPRQVAVRVVASDGRLLGPDSEPLVLRRGETLQAEVEIERHDFDGRVSLGKEFAGRNMPHGVYVDNIGLNGLLVPKGLNAQQFFITADPVARSGRRFFHLKAEVDGGITSVPIPLEIR